MMRTQTSTRATLAAVILAGAILPFPFTAQAQSQAVWDLEFNDYDRSKYPKNTTMQGSRNNRTPVYGFRRAVRPGGPQVNVFGVTTNVMEFNNVAPGIHREGEDPLVINMRVTSTAYTTTGRSNQYEHWAMIPDYHDDNRAAPDGDLGFIYQHMSRGRNNGPRVGGISVTFEFFLAGTENNGLGTPFLIPALQLLIYDVDGDANQVESVRAYESDGLYGYRLAKELYNGSTLIQSPLQYTHEEATGSHLFTGRGADILETDPSAATVLLYRNVSSFTLDFEAITTGAINQNGVFVGIDGDLSLLNGRLEELFGEVQLVGPVPVPEPSTYALIGAAGLLGLWLRRRHR